MGAQRLLRPLLCRPNVSLPVQRVSTMTFVLACLNAWHRSRRKGCLTSFSAIAVRKPLRERSSLLVWPRDGQALLPHYAAFMVVRWVHYQRHGSEATANHSRHSFPASVTFATTALQRWRKRLLSRRRRSS